MEVLDRVYNAFCHFERDFGRSKKSRVEFIQDKFGGDIEIGSMIILDAISSFNGDETPEDIEKLTFVKDMITNIKENAANLDKVNNFQSLGGERPADEFFALLARGDTMGMHQHEVTQAELNRQSTGTIHFIVTPEGTQFADLNKCRVVHAYNEHMMGMIQHSISVEGPLGVGSYVQLKSKERAVSISPQKVTAAIK